MASVSPPVRKRLVLDLLGPSATEHPLVLRESAAKIARLRGSPDAQWPRKLSVYLHQSAELGRSTWVLQTLEG